MQKGFAPVILILVITGLVLAGGFWAYQSNFQNIRQINSYDECIKAFHPDIEMYFYECSTPDGQRFVQELSEEEKDKLKFPTEVVDSAVETINWKTYIGETKYRDGSSKFSIDYPANWTLQDNRLLPRGENSDKGLESRIILGAGGRGGPQSQGTKKYPAGEAMYYYDKTDKGISGYVTFLNGNIDYIFELYFLPLEEETTFEKMLQSFKVLQ